MHFLRLDVRVSPSLGHIPHGLQMLGLAQQQSVSCMFAAAGSDACRRK